MRLENVLDTCVVKTISLPPETNLIETVQQMYRVDAQAVLVTEEQRLYGVLTAEDILRPFAAASPLSALETPLIKVLPGDPEVGAMDEPISLAIANMTTAGLGHLPVATPQGSVVISLCNLLRTENSLLHGEVQHLQEYIEALHDAPND